MKKRSILFLLLSALLLSACCTVFGPLAANAAPQTDAAAVQLQVTAEAQNFTAVSSMKDGKCDTFATGTAGASVTVTAAEDIGFLYVKFNSAPGAWEISLPVGSGASVASSACGKGGFLHEYADVAGTLGNTKTVEMHFDRKVEIAELQVWGKGEIPKTVQRWEPSCDRADILVLSAHADDDQLYFAGLLPYYAAVREVRVQVVFFTEHLTENVRWHERLDALWTDGIRNYPVVSVFPDQLSYTKEKAYANFKAKGFSEDIIVSWLAEQLRRFRPLVAVTHSFTGEYGHGQHMAAVDSLIRAADKAADASFVTPGFANYDLPKLYVHNYGQNTVRLDAIDTASDKLDGKTPFRVSQEGFRSHESQWYNDLLTWMYGTVHPFSQPASVTVTKAAQITTDSPLTYGLYRKAAGVPEDVLKNDLLENLTADSPAQPPETTAATDVPGTSSPAADTSAAPGPDTPDGTTVPEGTTLPDVPGTADPVTVPEMTTSGQTPSHNPQESSASFPPLSHKEPHGLLTVLLSAIVGIALLGLILWYGIQKIRHCNNK